MPEIATLQRRLAGADFLSFSEKAPGFIAIDIKTAFSTATIALQGAHVMTWQPVAGSLSLAKWPHVSTVKYSVTVGQELVVSLTTRNVGERPCVLGQALHTYFEIGDIQHG